MKIFAAENDPICRCLLQAAITKAGHEAVLATDGEQAWQILQAPEAPRLAILDWMMPGMNGVEVCRKLRMARPVDALYLVILTARTERKDMVAGLDSGADDYMVKPFDQDELRARIQAGVRILDLQQRLTDRIHALEDSLAKIKTLQGLLPICAWCKRVRDDQNYWKMVDSYISDNTDLRFTHCICPDCLQKEKAKL